MNARLFACLAAVLVLSACAPRPRGGSAPPAGCAQNLYEVGGLLRDSIPVEPDYPESLADLSSVTTNVGLFVCPVTGHKPHRLKTVEAWSDYIYVASLPLDLEDPKVALLICPPENHGGGYGYVLWSTRDVEKLSAADIRRLVETPWCFATNAPQPELDKLRKQVVVRVPKPLRRYYPEKNR